MDSGSEKPQVLWRHANPKETPMWAFKTSIEHRRGLKFSDYQALHRYSTTRPLDFWQDSWDFYRIIYEGSYEKIVDPNARLDSTPKWFQGVRLNFAENLLYAASSASRSVRSTAGKEDNKLAVVEVREAASSVRKLTWGGLRRRAATFARALKAHGLRQGDRVAAVMGNGIDTLCVLLATTWLGALFSSTSTDMGSQGLLERLRQIEPAWVFVDDAALYNGTRFDLRGKMEDLVRGIGGSPSFKGLVSVPRFQSDELVDISAIPRVVTLNDFLRGHGVGEEPAFARIPFDAGVIIVYSSGTTGPPKCIVHGVGGVTFQAWKDGYLHKSLWHDSVMLQFTTTSWIMYLAGVVVNLLFGSSVILYDGAPFPPKNSGPISGPDAFLRIAGLHGATHIGVSPRFFATIQAAGIVPRDIPGLSSSLKHCTSTGMVLPRAAMRWFYSTKGFPPHVHLCNISGGTDIAGCWADGNPLSPVYDEGGSCQGPQLGMDVRVFDSSLEHEKREVDAGQPGDLVCVKAFPSMPVKFWGDQGGRKYHAAYFERFDNVWTHGDFILRSPATGAVIFLGRADGVLNPSGVRFGSAEIYAVLEARFAAEIEDSVCVGQRRKDDTDEMVLLFLKLRNDNSPLKPALAARVKAAIAESLSKRHVPKYIFETPEIPVTVNGKKVELPIKRIVSGEKVTPSGTLANPSCLKFYERFVHSEQEAAKAEGRSRL